MIDKRYSSDSDPDIPKERIIDALRAGNKLSAAMATDIANMKIGIHEHKRAMGDSHQQVENVIVDETSKVMNHMTNEFDRQLKERNQALMDYFEKMVAAPELVCKLMEVLEKHNNRITYGETIEEAEE
tara:strand:- start:422 stop:805 length:384 start_codon:yes stop_codon:yes gene_type:complete